MVTLEVHNLDKSITLSALINGLQKNDLKKSLIKTYPQDFANILAQAEKYTWIENTFIQEDIPVTSLLGGGRKL